MNCFWNIPKLHIYFNRISFEDNFQQYYFIFLRHFFVSLNRVKFLKVCFNQTHTILCKTKKDKYQ